MFDQNFALLPELLLLGSEHLLSGLYPRDKLVTLASAVLVFAHNLSQRGLHHVDLT